MTNITCRGPICQLQQQTEINDGTLARVVSNPPGPAGMRPASSSNTPVAQTSSCKYVDPISRGTLSVSDANFNRLRSLSSIAKLSAPSILSAYKWRYGPPTNAVKQVVTIDGHGIKVIRPPDSVIQKNNLPTIDQVVKALRAIPKKLRRHTKIVKLSPAKNPESSSERVIAGEGGADDIILYPVRGTRSQNNFDYRMMHESGHNYQSSIWNSAQSVAEWRAAITSDGNFPTPYARSGTGEDFCEFYVLFVVSKGTNCALRLKTIYPARWKKMTAYFGTN